MKAEKVFEGLIDRGMDFLVAEAKDFVLGKKLYKISSSQFFGLCSVVNSCGDYANLKQKVENWLGKQSEKRTNNQWQNVKDNIINKMFVWDDSRLKKIQETAERKLKTEFDAPLSQDKMSADLQFMLARSVFHKILAYYRIYADEKMREMEGIGS